MRTKPITPTLQSIRYRYDIDLEYSPRSHSKDKNQNNLLSHAYSQCSEHGDWKCHHYKVQERVWNFDSNHKLGVTKTLSW